MFGYLIPRSYKEALEFDKENNNSKSADATMPTIRGYSMPNHQKIRVNLIFVVKFNGRHKARLVADGSLTPDPVENIYSGVVSLRHLRRVYSLGSSTTLNYGELILGMPIWKPTHVRSSSSLLVLNLKNLKASSLSSTWHYMVTNQVEKGVQKGSMTSSRTWDSRVPKLIHVYGLGRTGI